MKKASLTLIILIGIYTLLRNNVFVLPGQHIWSAHPDIFYKIFIPLLMVVSSLISIIKSEEKNILYLAFGTLVIDAIHRLALGVNHFYHYIIFDPPPDIELPENTTRVIFNHWPSHIMGVIEFLLILSFILLMAKEINNTNNS